VRAILHDRYGPPDVLRLADLPDPVPGPGAVLVRTEAASLNPVDRKIRSGLLQAFFPVTFPAIPGRDGAGVVEAVGPGGPADLIGRRVCFVAPRGMGTWAERIAIDRKFVVPVPDELSTVDAAALALAGVSAWEPLAAWAPVGPGTRVLVQGAAGGVGGLAVQIAKSRGAWVAGTCSARNAAHVRGLGADAVVAYDEARFEEALSDIDVVFDLIGGEVHDRSYRVLKRGGAMLGLVAAPVTDRGAAFGVTVTVKAVAPDADKLAAVIALAVAGTIRADVGRTVPLARFREAVDAAEGPHARGKTVLTFGG